MPFKPAIVPKTALPEREKARLRVKAMPKPGAMLQCRCGSRELMETRTGVLLVAGKPRGGTKQLICAECWRRGERAVVA